MYGHSLNMSNGENSLMLVSSSSEASISDGNNTSTEIAVSIFGKFLVIFGFFGSFLTSELAILKRRRSLTMWPVMKKEAANSKQGYIIMLSKEKLGQQNQAIVLLILLLLCQKYAKKIALLLWF